MMIVITAFILMKVDVLLDGREEPRQGLKGCVQDLTVLLFVKIIRADNSV